MESGGHCVNDAGWSRTPNEILDAVPLMSEVEIKLTFILVRLTYGYHRNDVRMTYDDMQAATGIKSRSSIDKAICAIEARGFFARGRRSMWCVNSPKSVLNGSETIVHNEDFSPKYGPVNSPKSVLKSSPKSGLSSIEVKKEEIKKEYNPFPFKGVPENIKKRQQETPAQARVSAILEVCGMSASVPLHVTKAENAAAQINFVSAGYIRDRYSADVPSNGHWQWFSDDWRGQKGQMPTPEAVLETIQKKRVAVKPHGRSSGTRQALPANHVGGAK